MPAAFARMAEAAGAPPAHLMADFAALAFGPGRISFADYERLRLYDAAFWGAADRRAVAGAAQGRRIARIANFRRDCWGLASDRLASSAYLAAHGLPTVPTLAIYRAGLAAPGASLLRTRDELRQFLQERAGAPLIARPSEGGPGRRLFAGVADPAAEIDRFIDAVSDAGAGQLALPGAAGAAPRAGRHPPHRAGAPHHARRRRRRRWSPAPRGCSADRTRLSPASTCAAARRVRLFAGAGRRSAARARPPTCACPTGRR